MRRRMYKYVVCASVCVITYSLCYFFGVSDYMNTKNFENEFDYPLNIDIRPVVEEILSGKKPNITPINYYPFRFLTNSGKCKTSDNIDLVIVVKSAMSHFGHRMTIRKTFGQENFIPERTVKLLFFLGIDGIPKSDVQREIDTEMAVHKDIIQIDFLDNYFNNTIKTMMSFRWTFQHCPNADIYLFTDDDMYISLRNLFEYIEKQRYTKDMSTPESEANNERDKRIFAGYVFKSVPHRIRSSKWRVSLDEYPWDSWPRYVTAGAYIVSNESMKVLYIASLFVKHFRFDDIYLGIVAKKAGIVPTHCPEFYFYKKKYTKAGYRHVIASHGYSDHEELTRVWKEQNNLI